MDDEYIMSSLSVTLPSIRQERKPSFIRPGKSEKREHVEKTSKIEVLVIVLMTAVITILHYFTELGKPHYHLLYQGLYFVPIMLAGFWFGLRGALATSLSITVVYLPVIVMRWSGFSSDDLSRVMEMVLYNVVALVLGVIKDREMAEQRRGREAERLAAMGRAMSGAVHDMKTPLIAIGGFTVLVHRKLAEMKSNPEDLSSFVGEACEKLGIVIKETRRLESMVKEMLDFSRPLELRPSSENIDAMIEECFNMVETAALEKNVKLKKVPSKGDRSISCDPARMKQAIINLLMNAIQASPEGTTVTISSHMNREGLAINVADCGCGIPVDKREEIFLPFVTTKHEGTGLGLPIVKKIVEAHRGYIEIVDNPEQGITFRIFLPHAFP